MAKRILLCGSLALILAGCSEGAYKKEDSAAEEEAVVEETEETTEELVEEPAAEPVVSEPAAPAPEFSFGITPSDLQDFLNEGRTEEGKISFTFDDEKLSFQHAFSDTFNYGGYYNEDFTVRQIVSMCDMSEEIGADAILFLHTAEQTMALPSLTEDQITAVFENELNVANVTPDAAGIYEHNGNVFKLVHIGIGFVFTAAKIGDDDE